MPLLRLDREGEPEPNGSVPVYADWMGGPSLAAVRNCPVNGTDARRSARVTGEPDTYFSQPATVSLNGRRVRGFLARDESGFTFNPSKGALSLAPRAA
jgi:hypothetical protein